MKLTASLKKTIQVAGALLVAAGLLTAIGSDRASADNDVNQCPAGRPCINFVHATTASNSANGRVTFQWTGEWERYNIELRSPGMQTIKKYDIRHNPVHPNSNDIVLLAGAWNRTWTLMIEGCDSSGIFDTGSDCTDWATAQITLRAPDAPKNVRLVGNTVHWDRLDELTLVVSLRGTQRDGKEVEIAGDDFRANQVRSLQLPGAERDDFRNIKACAENPGGRRCTNVPGGEAPPAPLPEKPATPANFRGQYQNGFGTRIFLDWNDTSTETYYYLTAHSVVGDLPQRLPDPAPKLGANSNTFIVTGDLTALVGGIEFRLQACNPGGCSAQAKVVVK